MKYVKKIMTYIFFIYNKIVLHLNKVHIKNNTIFNIRGCIFIRNKGSLVIEDDVRINSSYRKNPIGGQTFTSLVVRENAKLIIKKGAGISNSAIVAYKNIVIEEDVYIGGDCKIYDTDFHSIEYKNRIGNDMDINSRDVLIKKGAFIGTGSIILKGVTIGEESVIGAGSVVTKDIPAKEIWAGNPAKFIKKLEERDYNENIKRKVSISI